MDMCAEALHSCTGDTGKRWAGASRPAGARGGARGRAKGRAAGNRQLGDRRGRDWEVQGVGEKASGFNRLGE
jgi:hypothetical protein